MAKMFCTSCNEEVKSVDAQITIASPMIERPVCHHHLCKNPATHAWRKRSTTHRFVDFTIGSRTAGIRVFMCKKHRNWPHRHVQWERVAVGTAVAEMAMEEVHSS